MDHSCISRERLDYTLSSPSYTPSNSFYLFIYFIIIDWFFSVGCLQFIRNLVDYVHMFPTTLQRRTAEHLLYVTETKYRISFPTV